MCWCTEKKKERNKEPEKQRNKETKKQRNKETKKQRNSVKFKKASGTGLMSGIEDSPRYGVRGP